MMPLTIMTLEMLFVAGVMLFLYRQKQVFGLTLLYIFVGSNQYMQTILAGTVYLPMFGNYYVSPGSVVLFSSSLFAILLVYLKADVPQTRAMIYGIVLSNVTLFFITIITDYQFGMPELLNMAGISRTFFIKEMRSFLWGTVTLSMDAFLIIVLYEFIYFKMAWLGLYGRILGTLIGIMIFDSVLFCTGSFIGTEQYGMILKSQLIGKTYSGFIYGSLLYLYLVYVDGKQYLKTYTPPQEISDIFSILTYRERYEQIRVEKEVTDEKLRESEEKWAILVKNVPDNIFMVDSAGNILFVNRDLSGQLNNDSLRSIYDMVVSEDRDKLRVVLEEVLKYGTTRMCDISTRDAFGTLSYYLASLGPIKLGTQERNIIIITTNITQMVKSEEEKRQLMEELSKKEKLAAIGQTIESIAHCMKNIFTPLSATLGMLDHAWETNNSLMIDQIRPIIRSSSLRLEMLLMNMLDYSKNRTIDLQPVDIRTLFSEVVDHLSHGTRSKQIQFIQDVSTDSETIMSDSQLLYRNLMNLGTNAIDAIAESGTVSFKAYWGLSPDVICNADSPDLKDNYAYIIEVADTGSGMDVATKTKIFEPFFSTKGSQGTGLGLMTVKQAMSEMHGKVFVESEPGKGTTIKLVFGCGFVS